MADILVVDDDEDFAAAVALTLAASGHQVEIALDTKRAADRVQQKPPDLMILDVMFPEDDAAGFTFARELQSAGGRIPILMLTAINAKFPLGFSAQDIDDAWMPVAEFLEKPVDLDILRTTVARMLSVSVKASR